MSKGLGDKQDVKEKVWRKLPKSVRPYAKTAYLAMVAPFDYPRNLNRFKYDWQGMKREKISYVPPTFVVTINSTCNLRCPNCFYVIRNGERAFEGGGMIKVEDLKEVMDKYHGYIKTVWFTGGEPLAHPRLDKLVDVVKEKGLVLKVNTNGVFIDRKIDLLSRFDYINVSVDGYDHETFKRYREGTPGEFDRIVNGLALLKQRNIKFSITFVLSEGNLAEGKAFLDFAEQVVPNEVGFHNMNPHGSNDFCSLTMGSAKVRKFLDEITARTDYPYDIDLPVIFDTESPSFRDAVCQQQWYYAAFNDKGHVSYCCHMDHDADIGNMFKGYDFNSEKMVAFRRRMLNHEYPENDCLNCHRRFMGRDQKYARFVSSQQKWIAGAVSTKELPL